MAGVSQGDNAHFHNTRLRIRPLKRARKLFPIVHARYKHNLHMHLNALVKKALDHLHAPRRMFSNKPLAHFLRHSVKGNAQRRDALLHNARLVFGSHIRHGHECARKKTQSEVIVAQRQRRTHIRR